MSETLPRTTSAPDTDASLPTDDELRARVYGPESQAPAVDTYVDSLPYLSIGSRLQDRLATTQSVQESDIATKAEFSTNQTEPSPVAPETTPGNREISRAATIFDRIANTLGRLQERSENIGGYFKERKLNKLHSKALTEYRSDHYLDYVGHINKLAESGNKDYQAYAQPIAEREAPRAQRTINKLHNEALKEYRSEYHDEFVGHVGKLAESDNEAASDYGQGQVNRERRRVSREKFYSNTKSFARSTGSAALEVAKTTGLFTLGAGMVAGEAISNGAKTAYKAGKDVAETGALAAMYGADIFKDAAGSLIESAKDRLAGFAESAKLRRDIRRQNWDNRKAELTKRGREAMTDIKDRKNKAIIGAHAIRAAVSNGVTTGAKSASDTYRALNK